MNSYMRESFELPSNTSTMAGTKFYTVCPGSSDPPEKIFNIFAYENEVYTIY